MINLLGLDQKELQDSLKLEKPFIADQIFQWIYKKCVTDFSNMTNLPKPLRERLSSTATIFETKVTNTLRDDDGTIKLQITTLDKNCIECVLLTDRDNRSTACLSSQAGCAMGCSFCKTGTLGFARNLSVAEIIEQFLHLTLIHRSIDKINPISNIVFMGMGEPLLNLNALKKSIAILTNKNGFALSPHRITISTCGIPSGIKDISDNLSKVGLALSLVTADNDLRSKLMGVNKVYDILKLKSAIKYYITKTNNRVTFEAVMLHNINTTSDCAKKLIQFCHDATGGNIQKCVINLIPWNKVDALPFETPDTQEIREFSQKLSQAGLNVTTRYGRGKSVSGACGQLGAVYA